MKLLYAFIMISFAIHADPVKIAASDSNKFGCSGVNNDYYIRKNIEPDRVIYNQLLMDKLTEREQELYEFLKSKVSKYHYSSEDSVHPPGYSFNKYYFEYQGGKIDVYRSISKNEQKTIGFCFEGKFSNELVRRFFSIDTISKIRMNGNGEFYLIDDAFSVVKFVKKDDAIAEIYIYVDYD